MDSATVAETRVSRVGTGSCARVALLAVSLYTACTAAYLLTPGHDVRDFIRIGTVFIDAGHGRSRTIHLDPGYHPPRNQNPSARGLGYDGQFSYYIAVDPAKARYYIDLPTVRYGRILYPLAARALALGQRAAIPWALLVINLLAVAAGTWALATWLRRRRASPWWALIYGLWPGMVIAVQRDLTEPLSYALVLAGLLLLDRRGRGRLPAAGAVFGLAGLARQSALVFPLVYVLWFAFGGEVDDRPPLPRANRRRQVVTLLALSFGPTIAFSVFLYAWLGSWTNGGDLTPFPFAGLFHGPWSASRQGVELLFVVIPTLVALIALAPTRVGGRRERWLPWLLLLANVLLNIVFFAQFHSVTYTTVSRLAIGSLVSAIMYLPYLGELDIRRRRWVAGAAAVAMSLLPLVAVYGFTNVSA